MNKIPYVNQTFLSIQLIVISHTGIFSVFDYVCGSRTIFVKLLLFSSCNDQYSGYHYNRACQQLRDRKSNFGSNS